MKLLTRFCRKIVSIAASELGLDKASSQPDFLSKFVYVASNLGLVVGRCRTETFGTSSFEYMGVFVVAFPFGSDGDAKFRISHPAMVFGQPTTTHIDLIGSSVESLNSIISAIKTAAISADKIYSKEE